MEGCENASGLGEEGCGCGCGYVCRIGGGLGLEEGSGHGAGVDCGPEACVAWPWALASKEPSLLLLPDELGGTDHPSSILL